MKGQPLDAAQILTHRAEALARSREQSAVGESIDVMEFVLAQERYAIETRYVVEAFPLKDLTPLPGTPSFVPGVVNLRGRVVPVYDLRKLFDLPEAGIADLHRVILVRGADMELGLLADVVTGVYSVELHRLQPSLPTLTGIRAQYLKGVTADRLIVLEMAQVLSDPKLIIQDESANSSPLPPANVR